VSDTPPGHEPHEKHLQLGTDLANDNRTPVVDPETVWADATTVEAFRDDIEALRAAGWPVGD
jgi:hypothetical protein